MDFNKKLDKCVIITTINAPTPTILKHISNTQYDTIIVGDKKTPNNEYENINCVYLDVSKQDDLFPTISKLMPYNHYCRKNIGYLYAFINGYKIIYETDDDNEPYDNFDQVLNNNNVSKTILSETSCRWINVFTHFTNNSHIWPRGFPLSLIKRTSEYSIKECDITPSIINGLVENDPDVDAIFRLTCIHENEIQWVNNQSVIVDNKNLCVFNTQNTFWLNPTLFASMLIPTSVSFRYCDILRGIISNIILKKTNNYMEYISPNVVQYRNEHNLIDDFKSEHEMYINNENILTYIEDNTESKLQCLYLIQSKDIMPDIYTEIKNTRDYVLLSYKDRTLDTTIFLPNSTWTTGRNKLREYALKLPKKYDYYIFLDEDVYLQNNMRFCDFEESLNKYRPFIGNPYNEDYYVGRTTKHDITTTIWFDGLCNAFSMNAFNSSMIFPYLDCFDNKSPYISQYAMIILCSLYDMEVVVFKDVRCSNLNHSDYPKNDVFTSGLQYITHNVVKNDKVINKAWDDHTRLHEKCISSVYVNDLLLTIYNNLLQHKVITNTDVEILVEWLKYF
jgi:hypothetical protein